MPLAATYQKEIRNHRAWLSRAGAGRLRRWENLLKANEESALCEACVRELLQRHVHFIEPAEDLATGGPDFRCVCKSDVFYVESTCLEIEPVSRHTGLSATLVAGGGPREYRDLTRLIRATAANKAGRLSDLDASCLLAIGTFHFEASGLCGEEPHVQHALTSTTGLSMDFDPASGTTVGEMVETTTLAASAVLREGTATRIEPVRQSISGLLLCGFGCEQGNEGWPIRGVIHPDAARPFQRDSLPGIRFCELEPGYEQGVLRVRWT
jgi:hypothetical protein